jgi:hypothetical protein
MESQDFHMICTTVELPEPGSFAQQQPTGNDATRLDLNPNPADVYARRDTASAQGIAPIFGTSRGGSVQT